MEFDAGSAVWTGLVAVLAIWIWRMLGGFFAHMGGTEALGKAMLGMTG